MDKSPLAGTLIEGKYEILSKIREGGMGSIYRVRHRLLDEVRVVKVMLPQLGSEEEYKQRFAQEAKMATRLKHANVATIYDFALDPDGTAYIVMEFIEGMNLAELLKATGPCDIPLSLEIAHQALSALGYLHRKNIVHRDIALDNLMLTRDEEERPHVKLIDLGISKPLDKTIELTSRGVFLGKLKYSSPEQLGSLPAGETLDGRSDLYSLGVVLYEMTTGKPPFAGDTPRELIGGHLFHPPASFEDTDAQGRVPPPLRALILKALEKKRETRFASAEDFDREVVALLQAEGKAEIPDATRKLFTGGRVTREVASIAPVTPSAQDRLDRQFGPQTTPPPSLPPLTIVPSAAGEEDKTAISARAAAQKAGAPVDEKQPALGRPAPKAAVAAGAAAREPPKSAPWFPPEAGETESVWATEPAEPPLPAPSPVETARVERTAINPRMAAERASAGAQEKASTQEPLAEPVPTSTREAAFEPGVTRRRPAALWIGLALAVAVVLLFWRPWETPRPEEVAVAPTAAPAPIAEQKVEPSAPPAPSPAPTLRPTAPPQPTAVPTSLPTARPVDVRPFRQVAESARQTMLRARQSSDQARARELAPSIYRRAIVRQAEAERLFARSADEEAKRAFDSAARLFGQSEAGALAAIRPALTPVQVVQLPTALPPTVVRFEATRAPPVERAPAPTAPAIRGNPAEERRIRQTVRLYEQAWSRFDSKLYERVYPSGIGAFELAIKNLRSQYVNIEIRDIDVDATGTSAVVTGNEIIVATPRAGTEKRTEWDVTLQLQRRDDRWIIVERH